MKQTVKICFVMDCTASMGPWMEAAKDHIQTLIYEAREQYPDATFQVGFVGYRDYGSTRQHIVYDFMDAEEIVRHIRPLEAMDGEDEAEDVAWGLMYASKLTWANSTIRMVYHIGDAPAHGDLFTGGRVTDRFPEGDPKHLDPRLVIKGWANYGYHYAFLRITYLTDTMLDCFHNAWTGRGTFRVIDLSHCGPDGLLSAVRNSMNETLTQHISTQDPEEA